MAQQLNKIEAWLRIPSLVRRYGPSGARAMLDVISSVQDDSLRGLVVQADALALNGQPVEAAQMYARAATAVGKDLCARQASALLETAVGCDPSNLGIRFQLILYLHEGCCFWRVGEQLQQLCDYDCSTVTLDTWIEYLTQLSIEPQLQQGLLRCFVCTAQQFKKNAEWNRLIDVIAKLLTQAQRPWIFCWVEQIKHYNKQELDNEAMAHVFTTLETVALSILVHD